MFGARRSRGDLIQDGGQSSGCVAEATDVRREREANVAFTLLAKAATRGADDAASLDQSRHEPRRGVGRGYPWPDVEARAWKVHVQPSLTETADERVTTALIDLAVPSANLVGHRQRRDPGFLNRLESA